MLGFKICYINFYYICRVVLESHFGFLSEAGQKAGDDFAFSFWYHHLFKCALSNNLYIPHSKVLFLPHTVCFSLNIFPGHIKLKWTFLDLSFIKERNHLRNS